MRAQLKKLIIDTLYKIYKIVRAPILWYQKRFNIQTRGVRILIVAENKILLVKHWYNGLWVMPGGGVHKNETPEYAAVRELREEVGLDIKQLDYLLGEYSNTKGGKNDTVYCYVVHLDTIPSIKKKFNFEISDFSWFDLNNLPKGTSQATRDRVYEYQTKDIQTSIRSWS